MSESSSANAQFEGEVRTSWDGGGIVDMRIEALRPVNGWTINVNVGGEIVNIWNARILAREGNAYRLGPVDYNVQIPQGLDIEIGVQVEGNARFVPLGITAARADEVAAEAPAPAPAPPPPPIQSEEPDPERVEIPTGEALGVGAERLSAQSVRFHDAPGAPERTGIFVEGETVLEPVGTGASVPRDGFAPGPFYAVGAQIIDSAGTPAKIHGINWFGLETDIFTPHGLWARNWREIMDEVRSLGFNTVRVPFSVNWWRRTGAHRAASTTPSIPTYKA